jgi:hypothetical protein
MGHQNDECLPSEQTFELPLELELRGRVEDQALSPGRHATASTLRLEVETRGELKHRPLEGILRHWARCSSSPSSLEHREHGLFRAKTVTTLPSTRS